MKTTESLLKPIESRITIEAQSSMPPSEYFKNRDGLYVWQNFADRILNKALSAHSTSYDIASYKLTKYADDEEIESGLPQKHIFSETDVCAILAALIGKQPKGEEGVLDNKYWNLFYTPTFVVGVGWDVGAWGVDAWGRGGVGWDDGVRVFSPAAES